MQFIAEENMSTYSIFKGLSKAYVENLESVKALYPLNFNNAEDFETKIKELDQEERWIGTEKVAQTLRTFNQSLGCGELTLNNLTKLENGALAIVTGQQAGIFTGALYTVYKAITAIKLARQLSKQYERDVVPIFWIASEDHDFQEIQQLKHYANGKVNTYTVKKEMAERIEKHVNSAAVNIDQHKTSVGHLKVTPEVYQTVETLLNHAAQEELENLQSLLKATLIEGDTLSNWFGKLMMKLFHDYGLVFVDPMLDGLRQLEIPLFKRAMEANEQIVQALQKQTDKVTALGFKPSLDFDTSGLNLFYYIGGERLPLKRNEGKWCVQQNNETIYFTTEELSSAFENEPDRFSTNVVLRPVAQDLLFKTVAYVAGPGEVSYYAQLSEVYHAFDKTMPIIFPRENFTILTTSITDKMTELDVDAEAMMIQGVEAIRAQVLDLQDDIRMDDLFEAYQKQVSEGYDVLIAQLEKISPEIHEFTEKNKGMILNQINYLQEKAHRFHRKNHKELLKELNEIEMQVVPEGGLQERTLSVIQYYGKSGDSFIDYLLNELPLETEHRIITI